MPCASICRDPMHLSTRPAVPYSPVLQKLKSAQKVGKSVHAQNKKTTDKAIPVTPRIHHTQHTQHTLHSLTSRSVNHSITQSLNQSVGRSVGRSVRQTVSPSLGFPSSYAAVIPIYTHHHRPTPYVRISSFTRASPPPPPRSPAPPRPKVIHNARHLQDDPKCRLVARQARDQSERERRLHSCSPPAAISPYRQPLGLTQKRRKA
ncbi:hypothetical protein BZA05DRAFT_50040 [Tricharina praecox]|uniref:uncharacterized protein n=1 Tax=Tricharina praecox TaxID=43433 RepID=UPI00221FD5FC|nr:uncharacterized protein BZA05DRAFT_50040 [Tricharina praecox]KAI5852024.1 hypothetical protein BZA05DRAFT_50040 [Tricharina praecox]